MSPARRNRRSTKTTRRTFMKAAGSAALATAWGPAIHAADKAGTKNPILGSGEHTYEAIHNWGQLPSTIVWGDTHGVAVDKAGFIYIKHRSMAEMPIDAIVVFDPDGKYVRSFGKEYHKGGHGIDVREENGQEFLYLCDMEHRLVAKTTLAGEQLWKLSYPQEANVYKDLSGFKPTNVAFAPDGGFYVADGYGSHYVHQYDKDAKWVRTWGGMGSEPGKFRTPHGIWLDNRPGREPTVVVADRANARLQYFTLDGKYLSTLTDVSFPAHFDIRGKELLVPDLHARVTILDADNKVVTHLGYDPQWTEQVLANKLALRKQPEKWEAGRFVHPHDACYDADGNIFVVEWVPTGRVTKLRHVG